MTDAKEYNVYGVDLDLLPEALQPFARSLAIHDALPAGFTPPEETPLRQILAGGWPTVADLRSLVEWGAVRAEPPDDDAFEQCAKYIEHVYERQFDIPWREDLAAKLRGLKTNEK